MPTDAIVPSTTESVVAENARISEFLSASSVFASLRSSLYHLREKPENTDKLLPALNEKISRMIIGAKRNAKIIPV